MIVEPSTGGFRIEVYAERTDGYWDATVRIRRALTDDKPYVERITCRKLTAELAETRAAIWARRWIDINGLDSLPTKRAARARGRGPALRRARPGGF